MNRRCSESSLLAAALFSIALSGLPVASGLAANVWTNSASGLWWAATNWSLASAPTSDSALDPTQITNAGVTTVTMDAATPALNRSVRSLLISAPPGSTNTLLVTGLAGGSPFTTSGTVSVNAGSVLRVTNSTVSALNTFDVSGALILDSGLIDTTPNFVGVRVGRASGTTGTVQLNGGILACFGLRLGDLSGSSTACTINGGTLLCTSVLSVGELLNSPASLTLLSGEVIATNDLTKVGNLGIGQWNQSGGTATFAYLSIADNLAGTMNLSNGVVIVNPRSSSDWFRIGNFDTGIFNQYGGASIVHSAFHVGDSPGISGFANILGGQFFATNDLCAIGRYGFGVMTVSNATVVLTNTSVGRHDSASGILLVLSNASVTCLDAISIGRFTNSQGSVQIAGGNLTVLNDDIWAGREGSGDFTISNGTVRARSMLLGVPDDPLIPPQGTATFAGGTTILSSNLLIGAAGFLSAQATLAGGALFITNQTATGAIVVQNGTFTLSGGTLAVDAIVAVTNGAQFTFNSGTLSAGSITVSNGAPFVVGNGVNPATLLLQGGIYSFADGLVIASNATVAGCGTILGSITNNGTLNTNCGANVIITAITRVGNTATVSFSTVTGATHVLEFKNVLSDPVWSAILPGVIGNGGLTNQQDLAATNGSRFYRIHVQ